MDTTTVTQAPGQFEIAADGETVGVARYVDDDGRRIFHHTEVDQAHSGQGLAGRLVGEALRRTREEGLRAVPVCSYVESYVQRHPDVADIVDPVTDEARERVAREA
ncbi:N-acetyltransferase [Georgenia sp. TF02-10]|uniref:GNAT family N-acetyltransferase n=1 Tax=Georgenia sp. TF02-10 TaxID=2917725 RepID=UPI001FA7CB1D|nr:GNAT family N-acetyltransferase [Georgenia sp. TF02-10]UNX54653.1 N-acetyltransferase [Georgenia sp. TF02-10]